MVNIYMQIIYLNSGLIKINVQSKMTAQNKYIAVIGR